MTKNELERFQGVPGLSSVISMLKNGRPATPRSWLYENQSPEWIRDEVLRIVDKYCQSMFDKVKREEHAYSKFAQQGGVPKINKEIKEIVFNSYTLCHLPRPMYKRAIWDQAKRNVISKLQLHGQLSRWTYQQVYDKMRLKGTTDRYAGDPTGGSKNEPEVFKKACEYADNGMWEEMLSEILIRSYRGKLRRVDMIPYSTTLLELSFVDPLLDHIMSLKLPELATFEGFDEVKRSLYKHHANVGNGMVFGGDSTKMDDHFGVECTLQVFDVLKHAFSPNDQSLFKKLCIHMHNIQRAWIDGKKIVGEHGLASGSGFTNLFETIHDMIVLEVAKITKPQLFIQSWEIGDDYCVALTQQRKYAHFFVSLFEACGLPGNLEKQSDDPDWFEFLQRTGIKGYIDHKKKETKMIYLLMSAMRSAVYPENFINPEEFNSDVFCMKMASIAENCVDHPAFVPWCQWIAKGQKDIIPFAKQRASKLDRMWKNALAVRGLRESYNNEKQNKPLSSFECIKVWSQM